MADFLTEYPNLGTFWRGLAMEDVLYIYFMPIWSILRPFGVVLNYYLGIFFLVLDVLT
jgi:hypothetical protein